MISLRKITISGIIINLFLFVIKLIAGIFSNSLALLSDAFHSLSDVLASIAVFIAVKVGRKPADATHPFGHHRAEPLAGFVVALLTAILGFEVLTASFRRLVSPAITSIGLFAFAVLFITIVTKIVMFVVFHKKGKEHNSPAVLASAIDARNDVFVSFIALIGIFGAFIGFPVVETIAAIVLAVILFIVAYKLGKTNVDYLMGHAPPPSLLKKIRSRVRTVKGVKLKAVKAHYVGHFLHLEINIFVSKKLSLKKAHDLGDDVKVVVEQLDFVDNAFVHINPSS